MTRKTEGGNSTATANRVAASLRGLRSHIDKLDLQILRLVNERASLAAEIGRVKNDHGNEVFSPAREEEVLQQILDANKGPLDASTIRAIYREIMSGSRALQKVLKVAYLGPEDSFSHLAAVERFGHAVEYMQVGSIAAVFEEVNRGHADFGVVPLENSIDGRVADTLDMFLRLTQLKICAEVRLPIHHNLLSNWDQERIRRVYSKEQALSQCRTWLSKNMPQAHLIPVSSTSVAAQTALREEGAAAVASREAAVRYGLRILFSDIEDSPSNETRFAVIGLQESRRSRHDKTAVMFKVPHHPGSLVDALNIFKQMKLNLTWIESFPAKEQKSEYVFFVDFEGHQEDPKVQRTLAALEKHCDEVTVLGSYPMASVAE
ncbi:MAG TPA: prephenate dehydratase [Gemmataceae bacterium]|jgi:chorismate mutase/prephenate dehydratase|nr:prephenate dehydratase [Gemmataceae bacterium]